MHAGDHEARAHVDWARTHSVDAGRAEVFAESCGAVFVGSRWLVAVQGGFVCAQMVKGVENERAIAGTTVSEHVVRLDYTMHVLGTHLPHVVDKTRRSPTRTEPRIY